MGVDENLINEIHNQDVGDNTVRGYNPISDNVEVESNDSHCNTHFGCGP